MSDKNFMRYFIILNECPSNTKKTHANGYCKIEGINSEAKLALSLRNMAHSAEYCAYATSKGSPTPIKIGAFTSSADGTVYAEYSTMQYNIFDSNTNVADIEAFYVLDSASNVMLCGYTNRSISEKAKNDCDIKLSTLHQYLPSADSESIDELDYKGDVPDEAESSLNALEALNTEIPDNTDVAHTDDGNSNGENGFTSYLDTFAKIYRELTGAKSEKCTVNEQYCAQDGNYMSKNAFYFENLQNSCDETEPFAFKQLNSKWIKVSNGTSFNIMGTVYENGKIKYIANGVPTTFYSFTVPFLCKYNIWLPSADNNCGVTGYWLTFIDAENGNAVIPDISIL